MDWRVFLKKKIEKGNFGKKIWKISHTFINSIDKGSYLKDLK